MSVYEHVDGFMALYDGFKGAFGTGEGRWVKRAPTKMDFVEHLQGQGPGIGIGPLRPDNTVMFAAIDLDEPDFEAARLMQTFLPGASWLEKSRSGNAHVLCFFKAPIEAWIPMGILKEATIAAGKKHVEVFPKNHDFSAVKFGNYINCGLHGKSRPFLDGDREVPLSEFVLAANETRNDPDAWRRRAQWLQMEPPERKVSEYEGQRPDVHMCAEYIIGRALSGEQPITEGHRAAVYFSVAKQLRNSALFDDAEALELLREANAASPDRLSDRELRRIFNNAANFRSTGCDEPLVAPFTHPDCPIARS